MGIHTILHLLKKEYIDQTTIRSLSKKGTIISALKNEWISA